MAHKGLQIKPDEQLTSADGVSDGDFLEWDAATSSWLPVSTVALTESVNVKILSAAQRSWFL